MVSFTEVGAKFTVCSFLIRWIHAINSNEICISWLLGMHTLSKIPVMSDCTIESCIRGFT